MKQRKGFAVFTPMVGTLVILITMLIVSSIILSERVAVQGSVKAYRSSELVNIATDAQSRVIEETRAVITSNLEEVDATGNPIMRITVYDCPDSDIANAFYPTPTCNAENEDEYNCICDENEHECSKKQTCWGKSFREVTVTAEGKLTGAALLDSTISRTIAGVVDKYQLTSVTAKDVEFRDVVESIKFMDCDPDTCKDGRLEITINYDVMADTPIAEVATQGKRLNVFMPGGIRVYPTTEPYLKYAKLTSDLFNDFQLLNNTWHGAAGKTYDKDDLDYTKTNGSEWYHYTYALHDRYGGTSEGQNEYSSAWNTGFFVENELTNAFEEGKDIAWYVENPDSELIKTPRLDTSSWIPIIDATTFKDLQSFRYDADFTQSNWGNLESFMSGYASTISGSSYSNLDLNAPARSGTAYPGGCISSDTNICNTKGSAENCLPKDTTFVNSNGKNPSNKFVGKTELINTTQEYDKRFEDKMKPLIDEGLLGTIKQEIVAGMGLAAGNTLEYTLNITSDQYYAYADGFQGKDNWHCGQFMSLYQTSSSFHPCSDARTNLGGGAVNEVKCDGIDCEPCTAGKFGDCPWFVSMPINWTCDSLTLYQVKETYHLYRSNTTHQNPVQPVFMATYYRLKDDYEEVKQGKHNNTLWLAYNTYTDKKANSGITKSFELEEDTIRRCVYSYNSLTEIFSKKCEGPL